MAEAGKLLTATLNPMVAKLVDMKVAEFEVTLIPDFLKESSAILARHQGCSPDIYLWQDDIASTQQHAPKAGKILIGFKGKSGHGKTAAVNALIGHDVFSTFDATSLPIFIEYNDKYQGELGAEYACDVEFISLCALYRIVNIMKHKRNPPPFEVAKFKLIWPNIQARNLTAHTVEQLIADAQSRYPQIGQAPQTIKASNADEFHRKIDPFVSREYDSQLWHVIERVTVYLMADLLKSFTIVDFWGSGNITPPDAIFRDQEEKIVVDATAILSPIRTVNH